MIDYEQPDTKTAVEAKADAQRIAFGPVVFQATLAMRRLGLLDELYAHRAGRTVAEIAQSRAVSEYGVRVLLEAGLSAGIVAQSGERFTLTKTGWFLLKDDLTNVNLNFIADVCYDGMRYLTDAIRDGKPAGLQVFGPWRTIYEGLSQLPASVQASWFAFDHFYSDRAFPTVSRLVFERPIEKMLDVGGNTGKWALLCAAHDPRVRITILDLPGQLDKARANIQAAGLSERIACHAIDLLDAHVAWPKGADAIWMSQFLDCFSASEIVSLLKRGHAAMGPNTSLYILETYWDRQQHEAAAFSLHNISLYFTCMANGNSKMYHSDEMRECVAAAGLRIVREVDGIGVGHTLWECRREFITG
jgi:methyltransferase family protein/O-methyltransferase